MSHRTSFRPVPTPGDPKHEGRCLTWARALVCIDLQYLNCRDGYGVFADHADTGMSEQAIQSYLSRLEETLLPNVQRLQAAFRRRQEEVIHIRIQSLTLDGRDRSLEHKELDLHAPPGSKVAEFLPEVAPEQNEIVVNKTASGVFIATNLEYILRNLCVSELYFTGVYTNECVSSAVRSASDLGFKAHLIADATAAITRELHEATLKTTSNRYASVLSTREVLESTVFSDTEDR